MDKPTFSIAPLFPQPPFLSSDILPQQSMIQHRIGALEKVNHEFKMPAITPLKTQQIKEKKYEKETVLGNYQGDVFFSSSPSEQPLPRSTTNSAMINESRTLPYLCS